MNTNIDPETGEKIIEIIANTGKANFRIHDVSEVNPLKSIFKKIKLAENLTSEEEN